MLISMVLGCYSIWADGVYMPKNSAWTLYKATWRARRAELARLPTTYRATRAVASVPVPSCERLILSARVVLHEQRATRWLLSQAKDHNTKLVWPDHNTERRVVISPTDMGTIALTDKRFIYTSRRKHRESPIRDLTHVSTGHGGIALAKR
jgi:hypothetical protein